METDRPVGFVKTVTWILSFGLLVVFALDSFGAFDHERPPTEATENELMTSMLVATPDGTVYAASYHGELWRIDGTVRRKVTGIPQDAYITDLVATEAGDVYAASLSEVWHIVDGSATLVRAQGRNNI